MIFQKNQEKKKLLFLGGILPALLLALLLTPVLQPVMAAEVGPNLAETFVWNPAWEYASFSQICSDSVTLYRSPAEARKNIVVAVNAGHGTEGGSQVYTQCHPDGSEKVTGGSTSAGSVYAAAVSGGTTLLDGTPEGTVTLALAQKVKEVLLSSGYDVLMIRETENCQLDNIARTVFANNHADCHISLHYDSSENDKGFFYCSVPNVASYRAMEPVASHWTEHNELGNSILQGMQQMGVKIYGSGSVEIDLTQTSYSTVPSVDIEVGDRASDHSEASLQTLAQAVAKGVDIYFDAALAETSAISPSGDSTDSVFGNSSTENAADEKMSALLSTLQGEIPTANGQWAVYLCDLSGLSEGSLEPEGVSMQAASLIKLFIMGAVYENYDALCQAYGQSTIDTNLSSMITVSDNDAANSLVTYLGSGDSQAGMEVVNTFCQNHGYSNTSMGRLLLQSNENGDNYTSVSDCGRFLKAVYFSGYEKSSQDFAYGESMFSLLKNQTRRNKIPAQMPEGVSVANKTGELSDVENDAGIIYDAGNDLIIVFMSQNLSEPVSAQTTIAALSREIYDYYN